MSQIAKCLVDSDVSISSFAQQFFVELSKKSNSCSSRVLISRQQSDLQRDGLDSGQTCH